MSFAVQNVTGVLQAYPLDRSQGFLEEVIVELLKSGSGEWLRQVHTLCQALHLHTHLMLTGQCTLCTLSLTAQLGQGAHIFADVHLQEGRCIS